MQKKEKHTVSLEALFTTLMIEAYKNQDVAAFDIPGDNLHAKMPKNKTILLKLRDVFAEVMCDVNPDCISYVIYEQGRKVIHAAGAIAICRISTATFQKGLGDFS